MATFDFDFRRVEICLKTGFRRTQLELSRNSRFYQEMRPRDQQISIYRQPDPKERIHGEFHSNATGAL